MLIYHQSVDEIILWIRILVQIKQILPPPPLLYRPSSPSRSAHLSINEFQNSCKTPNPPPPILHTNDTPSAGRLCWCCCCRRPKQNPKLDSITGKRWAQILIPPQLALRHLPVAKQHTPTICLYQRGSSVWRAFRTCNIHQFIDHHSS